MSDILSRPRFINPTTISIKLPDSHLDEPVQGTGPPSPITPMLLHCGLIQSLIEDGGTDVGTVVGRLSPSETMIYRDKIIKWMQSFPPAYRAVDTDTQFDLTYSYVPLQRLQLHATAYGMMLHPLKPYLTQYQYSSETELCKAAVDVSLSSIETLRNFFDFLFPRYTKFHAIACAVFDTAALLCCAIALDKDTGRLPRRDAILLAIRDALSILHKINTSSDSKTVAHSVLQCLVSKLPLTKAEFTAMEISGFKRPKLELSPNQTRTDASNDRKGIDKDPGRPIDNSKTTLHAPHETRLPLTMMELEPRLADDSLVGTDFDVSDYLVDWESLASGT